jgi:hypothetical protein
LVRLATVVESWVHHCDPSEKFQKICRKSPYLSGINKYGVIFIEHIYAERLWLFFVNKILKRIAETCPGKLSKGTLFCATLLLFQVQ